MTGNRIQSITAVGLTYLDESSTEHFIDFQSCYENHLARKTSPEALEDTRNWKEIGTRSISGDESSKMQPYIQFYTQPPTRFEFATVDEFYDIQNSIRRARWKTIDLT